jgi:hypothetical protein
MPWLRRQRARYIQRGCGGADRRVKPNAES